MISGAFVAGVTGGTLVGMTTGALVDFRMAEVIIKPFESNTVS
jgi:hypothetical protein